MRRSFVQILRSISIVSILLVCSTSLAGSQAKSSYGSYPYLQVTKLIVMPNAQGHTDWVNYINNAQRSIHMTMYHITDKAIITALGGAAKKRGMDVRVIVDGGSLTGGYKLAFQELQSAGVNVRASSTAFSLTHSKDMVVDDQTAFVTAINMTNTYNNTRDFGVITPDQGVIQELDSVFETDWQNAETNTGNTPELSDANLVWSPTTSNSDLVNLIKSAQQTIVAETETFSDDNVIAALNDAVTRGVKVRLVVPQCVEGNGAYNYTYLAQLSGVSTHVETDGDSVAQPYMHSKMMLIDGQVIYIGSINYTFNSIQNDREVGVIFSNPDIASQLSDQFETDWSRSQTMPPSTPNCSSSTAAAAERRDLGK